MHCLVYFTLNSFMTLQFDFSCSFLKKTDCFVTIIRLNSKEFIENVKMCFVPKKLCLILHHKINLRITSKLLPVFPSYPSRQMVICVANT